MASIALIYTTVENLETAKRLGHHAIQEKMALCVNILPHGLSIYEWQGTICEEQECYMIFKTSSENKEVLLDWLKQYHPYHVPVLISSEVAVNAEYAKTWMTE